MSTCMHCMSMHYYTNILKSHYIALISTYIVPGIIRSRLAELDHKGLRIAALTDFPELVGQTRIFVPVAIITQNTFE